MKHWRIQKRRLKVVRVRPGTESYLSTASSAPFRHSPAEHVQEAEISLHDASRHVDLDHINSKYMKIFFTTRSLIIFVKPSP